MFRRPAFAAPSPLALLCLAALCAAAPGRAQEEQEGDPDAAARARMEKRMESGEWEGDEPEPGKEEAADPNAVRGGLERFAAPVVGFKPRRIAPGGSGEMRVVLALQGTAVLLPDGEFEPRLPESLGPVRFGSWRRSEPRPSAHHDAFAERPLWDDTLTLTVPITVAPDAAHGEQPIAFQLVAEIFDGSTGDARGRFGTRVHGRLEIGDPLPTPAVMMPGGSDLDPALQAGAAQAQDGGEATDGSAADDAAAQPVGGQRLAPDEPAEPAPAAESTGGGPPPAAPESGGVGLLVWIGGGAVLLLVLLLALTGRGAR